MSKKGHLRKQSPHRTLVGQVSQHQQRLDTTSLVRLMVKGKLIFVSFVQNTNNI